MNSGRDQHWDAVYQTRASNSVSWYRPHLDTSIALLQRAGMDSQSRVIDIGAGASTLVDDLLALGVRRITAVDLSATSLDLTRKRLGADGESVVWIVGDITRVTLPPSSADLWHDRAAFHFLVTEAEVRTYVQSAARTVVPGGHAVIGQFAMDGPERCSGLPVMRRGPVQIAAAFSPAFHLDDSLHEVHVSPGGSPQSFVYALLKRRAE